MKKNRSALFSCVILLIAGMILSGVPAMAALSDVTEVSGLMPLVIYDVQTSGITAGAATISWNTNGQATSQVFYDTQSHVDVREYDSQSNLDNYGVIHHSITLEGLSSSTTYYCRLESDFTGNSNLVAISSELTFETLHTPQTPTITIVSSSLNWSDYGETVYFDAWVISVGDEDIPTGTVTFYDGATLLDSNRLLFGLASISTNSLQVGSHTITAVYSGDATLGSSTSNLWIQNVLYDSASTIIPNYNPSAFNQTVAYKVKVNILKPPGNCAPNPPSVSFFEDANRIGTDNLSGTGVTFFGHSLLPVGFHCEIG